MPLMYLPIFYASKEPAFFFWIGSCETGWNKAVECRYDIQSIQFLGQKVFKEGL